MRARTIGLSGLLIPHWPDELVQDGGEASFALSRILQHPQRHVDIAYTKFVIK